MRPVILALLFFPARCATAAPVLPEPPGLRDVWLPTEEGGCPPGLGKRASEGEISCTCPDGGAGDTVYEGGQCVSADTALAALPCPPGTLARRFAQSPVAWCARPDGTRDGPHLTWWPRGPRRLAEWYQADAVHGYTAGWHANGRAHFQGVHLEGRLAGTWSYWDQDGAALHQNRLGVGDGAWLETDATGQKRLTGQVVGGRRDGAWTAFAADGTQLGQNQLARGRGLWREWLPDGTLASETEVADDRPHGRHTAYLLGQKILTGSFRDGHREGRWTHYAPDGSRLAEETYAHGLLHGSRTLWQAGGRVLAVESTYERGDTHGAFRKWHPNGQVALLGSARHGKQHGRWRTWEADGKPVATQCFRDGALVWEVPKADERARACE